MKIVTDLPSFQGDLCIFRVKEIPGDAKPITSEDMIYALAHSETGHHHVIDRQKAEVFEAADDEFVAYVRSLGDAKVIHRRNYDTHETLLLKPGNHEVHRQREHVADGYRRAAD